MPTAQTPPAQCGCLLDLGTLSVLETWCCVCASAQKPCVPPVLCPSFRGSFLGTASLGPSAPTAVLTFVPREGSDDGLRPEQWCLEGPSPAAFSLLPHWGLFPPFPVVFRCFSTGCAPNNLLSPETSALPSPNSWVRVLPLLCLSYPSIEWKVGLLFKELISLPCRLIRCRHAGRSAALWAKTLLVPAGDTGNACLPSAGVHGQRRLLGAREQCRGLKLGL